MGLRDLVFAILIAGGAAWTLGPLGWSRSAPGPISERGDHASNRSPDLELAVARLNTALQGPDACRAARADDLALLRRLHLALTGSIPSLTAVRAFEATGADPARIDHWASSLLADRRTSDYLAERLARALVGVENGPFLVYRRRRFVAWLADEIHQNRPYDQIVRALVAERGLGTDHPATNFVAVTYDDATRSYDPEVLAARAARAFLGVRLDCAQCHDHPFASWRRSDFQGLAAFFGQVEARASGVVDGLEEFRADARSAQPGAAIAPRVPFQAELVPEAGTRRERLAGWITDPRNRSFRRAVANRVWALLLGQPLVEPIDDIADAESIPPALDVLADDLAEHGFNLHRLIRLIVASDQFRLDSRTVGGTDDPADPTTNRSAPVAWGRSFPMTLLRPEQLAGSIIQVGSTSTIDGSSHILTRLVAAGRVNDFLGAHGDLGADEFARAGPSTIPQRLLLMNGGLVADQIQGGIGTAAGRIARLAPNDQRAIEAAFLVTLTRRPTPEEARHFVARLAEGGSAGRAERLSDLFWVLVNSTEFGTNH